MVGRYAVLLQNYDEKLSASEIIFDRLELWVRILNLPLGWMNQARGSRAMSFIGSVVKMDVDTDGKASGAFLRGRVAVEIDKPLRHRVLLRMSKTEEPCWFHVLYERLPYYCFACGKIGHSEMDCPTPVARDEHGKLPYDVELRALEERRRRLQTFAAVAEESFGSGSSSAFKPQRSRSNESRSLKGNDGSRHSTSVVGNLEDQEVQSSLKEKVDPPGRKVGDTGASRHLNL